jgi:hypothetical protein
MIEANILAVVVMRRKGNRNEGAAAVDLSRTRVSLEPHLYICGDLFLASAELG